MHRAICTIIFIFVASAALAQPVYKAPSPTGKSTLYSSQSKGGRDEKPANLPPIVRVDPEGKTFVRQTCHSHGGIDCAAGPDKDGSVICYDKYKDTGERFNFSCTAPGLEIAQISKAEAPANFKVLIRNTAATDAKGVKVDFKPEIGGTFHLEGTATIKGFQSGEFLYKPLDEFHKFSPPDQSVVAVSCSNCP